MKKVLIICPHFPPVNAADMHRIRHSLPYFKKFGWEAEIATVYPHFIEAYSLDPLLLKTIPDEIKVHYVNAWDAKKSRKFGLGSLSMRSFFHFLKKGNEILKKGGYDLIYFSTTAFHVMALGRYWQKKFKIPFVVDIQDPWRNDFYLSKPKSERPKKFFISYRIDKFLEAYTIPSANGIISVSDAYIKTFNERYRETQSTLHKVIPFSGSPIDFEVMEGSIFESGKIHFDTSRTNIVYIGRGGYDMDYAIRHFFLALKKGLDEKKEIFSTIKCWFIGTSYALEGKGIKTIQPIAEAMGLGGIVTEVTDRIPFFESLFLMRKADILFVPGSVDAGYTASKIYPYILAERPLLAIFNEESSVVQILKKVKAGTVVTFPKKEQDPAKFIVSIYNGLIGLLSKVPVSLYDKEAFKEYGAEAMTYKQVSFFDEVISSFRGK